MNRIVCLLPTLVWLMACGPVALEPNPPAPADGACGDVVEVTLSVADDCDGAPVTLARLNVAYPDGTGADIQPALDDPAGVYRIPNVVFCEVHRLSALADGYVDRIDVPVRFTDSFVGARMTPLAGCAQ